MRIAILFHPITTIESSTRETKKEKRKKKERKRELTAVGIIQRGGHGADFAGFDDFLDVVFFGAVCRLCVI